MDFDSFDMIIYPPVGRSPLLWAYLVSGRVCLFSNPERDDSTATEKYVQTNKNLAVEMRGDGTGCADGRPGEQNNTHVLRPNTTVNFCIPGQYSILQLVRMSEVCLVVAGIEICAPGGSATVTGSYLKLLGAVIISPSIFFPSPAARLCVTRVWLGVFQNRRITLMLISRQVQILWSSCVSHGKSFSLVSFETDSELAFIKSKAFSSISFETESELARIEAGVFNLTALSSVVVQPTTAFIAGRVISCNCVSPRGRDRGEIQ
jgi:hypothetical protein